MHTLKHDGRVAGNAASPPRTATDSVRLRTTLSGYLGPLDDSTFDDIAAHCEWIAYDGGTVLFSQGSPGDAAYLLMSGRLRMLRIEADGEQRRIGDITTGEIVGEMAVLSGELRSATVVAARDSIVVRIGASSLRQLFTAYPQLLLQLAKLTVRRASRPSANHRRDDYIVNITVVPLSGQVEHREFCRSLARALRPYGSALVLDQDETDRLVGEPGIACSPKHGGARHRRLTGWLNHQESQHAFVIYVANPGADPWTERCLRQGDRIVLLADPRADPAPARFEKSLVAQTSSRFLADTVLALWHEEGTSHPAGTARWLDARPWVRESFNLKRGTPAHLERLARILTGNAIGLVLGSGGARGLAHVGVYRALVEAGIPIDRVGGTSIGALVAACIAFDRSADEVTSITRASIGRKPTAFSDLSPWPMSSLYRGKRLERLLEEHIGNAGIEDLWTSFFCVSSDIWAEREIVHTRGLLKNAVRASASLPGVFPPVRIGDGLHVDGAFMNALPIDVMANFGMKHVLAVNLDSPGLGKPEEDRAPDRRRLTLDRLFRRKKSRYRVPGLITSIIHSSLLASTAKAELSRRDADLIFNPDVRKFNLMAWSQFDKLVALGYEHARRVLADGAWPQFLVARMGECAEQVESPVLSE
ncbi:patatin-like phospholipase family protein [Paraburkholderia sp. CI3]|uniref:patatin-like phospholipase family protein n=1 Tax=Paraburkholderia sp. CI3 TaxID=2991060 RepID=UPI003D1CA5AD